MLKSTNKRHHLQKAQRSFAQLANGEIALHKRTTHIKDMLTSLSYAGEVDIAKLTEGKSTTEVSSFLNNVIANEEKNDAIEAVQFCLERNQRQGKTQYEPESKEVAPEFHIPSAFKNAGIKTDIFDNDGRPSMEQMNALLENAKAHLKDENTKLAEEMTTFRSLQGRGK